MTTNVFGSGGFSSSSVASNTSIYATPFRNATPATSVPETTSTNSGVDMSPNIPKSSPLQGVAADDPLMNSYKAPTGQNSVNYRSTAETGTMFSQASSNNRKVESPTGGKPDFGFFRERSGGGGRPPSVIDLGSATYDFRNFPEFDAKAYKDFKPPSEMDQPKKRVLFQASKLAPKRSETWQSKLTEEAIPPPKGPLFDFGLSSIPDSPPTSEGCSHHGGISLSVNLDELPEAEPVRLPYSIFTARVLPPLDLPWLTPEADNWSEIGKPPRRIEDSPYSPFSPDLKDDPEFWWDPYDFDPEAKLLKQQCVDDTVDTNTKEVGGDTAVQQEPGAGVQQEPGAGVKAVKESEASDPPVVVNAAVS
ncbi:hypothetical protein KP509_18G017900 [Ceratopteris richardii]|nr:hypothetical protein KP509_18G017900 [Ceratopteris richardii]